MIRRTPTRIELKLEDISEYEQQKREAEAKKAMAKHNLLGSSPITAPVSGPGVGAGEMVAPPPTKPDLATVHSRIGYDPTPKLQ